MNMNMHFLHTLYRAYLMMLIIITLTSKRQLLLMKIRNTYRTTVHLSLFLDQILLLVTDSN